MESTVLIAIIGAAAAIAGPGATYLVARQNSTDRRASIAKDIELAAYFPVGSQTRNDLELHIKLAVASLMDRDRRRDMLSDLFRGLLPGLTALTVMLGTSVLHERFPNSEYNSSLVVLFWGAFVAGFLYALSVVRLIISGVFYSIKSWRRRFRTKKRVDENRDQISHLEGIIADREAELRNMPDPPSTAQDALKEVRELVKEISAEADDIEQTLNVDWLMRLALWSKRGARRAVSLFSVTSRRVRRRRD